MNIEQEIRAQIEKNKGLKLAVGEINNHLSILEGLLRNERDDAQKQVDEAYQRGVEDGRNETWEAARKALYANDYQREVIFGDDNIYWIMKNHTVSEAIAKLKAYEEKQKADDSIIVGDEVKAEDGTAVFFVTWMSDRCICGIDKEGKCYSYEPKEICGKTGIHFDIILEEKKE
jgi:hypothetical protein